MRNREDGTEMMGVRSKDGAYNTGPVAYEVPVGCPVSRSEMRERFVRVL